MLDDSKSTDERPRVLPGADLRDGLVLNTYVDGQRLIGLAQPTEWSGDGIRMAGDALAACLLSLQSTRYMVDVSETARLIRAINEASDAVRSRNRMRNGHQAEAAIGVGLALALRNGRTATMALIPPAQIVIMQGGTLTWTPVLESWKGKRSGLDGSPLGCTASPKPVFLRTQIGPGDQFAAVSRTIAEGLGRSGNLPGSADDLCRAISELGERSATGASDMVAVVTRFEPDTTARSLRSSTSELITRTDRRARAVWSALRNTENVPMNEMPRSDSGPIGTDD
jgi:hypothetical protein